MKIRISRDELRPFQKAIKVLLRHTKLLTLACSRQIGKTHLIRDLLLEFLFKNKELNPKAFFIGFTQESAFRTAGEHMIKMLGMLPSSICTITGGKTTPMVLTLKRAWKGDYATLTIIGSGSQEALRGIDKAGLIMIDEAESIKGLKDLVLEKLLPTTDERPCARIIISSTVKSGDSEFALVRDFCKKLSNHVARDVELNLINSGARDKDFIDDRLALYLAANDLATFRQEYFVKVDEKIDPELFPFKSTFPKISPASVVHEGKREVLGGNIYSVTDVGVGKNSATWIFKLTHDNKPHFIEFKNEFDSIYDMVDYIVGFNKNCKIILSWDSARAETSDSRPLIDKVREYAYNTYGYEVVDVDKLPKTECKKTLIARMLTNYPHYVFDYDGCAEGLELLDKVKFKSDKQGNIDFSKFEKNKARRDDVADALAYVSAAIDLGLIQSIVYEEDYGYPQEYRYSGAVRGNQAGQSLRYYK